MVRRTERITPHMIRVVLTADDFVDNGTSDHYVKLLFGKDGVEYPEPLDMGVIRETFPSEQWPTMRTYTVRNFDEAARELTIDFVYHGDEGIAGPWAAAAQPGDVAWYTGPGGGYAPEESADWHLLVGDESALPAIGAAIEQLPPGAKATVLVEVEDETEEQKFSGAGEVELTWFHRATAAGGRGDGLVAAVEALTFPEGVVQAFVHGEAGFVFRIRKHLFTDRGLSRDRVSVSGYWRVGKNEDGWQAEKAETAAKERAAAGN
ncbi:siderophore-interacting protein [Kribbella sp. NBC_01505]|uniref:siderophore-interacting protein n=1 Tax=Kribbella sp. NBC_01505 TaxID=2903580 RepID=UPI003870B123